MVGVAGKSKGCATCRKRKIKCDENLPGCDRCKKANLICGGYARYPVFIDHDLKGYRKREPFEEVQSRAEVPIMRSVESESVRLISWFCGVHRSGRAWQHALQARYHWLDLVVALQSPHPALKTALLAVAFVKWSTVEGDDRLRQHGRKLYSQSLSLTREALTHREYAVSDDILACTCVMVLYELTDSTTVSSDSWLEHVSGIGKLLCLRGPGTLNRAVARAVFEQIRCIFMLHHLMSGTSSIFGNQVWLQMPWQGVEKSVEQKILDQGLRLAHLLERSESISTSGPPPADAGSLLNSAVDVYETLDCFEAELSSHTLAIETDPASNLRVRVMDPETQLLRITILGMQLGAAMVIHTLLTTYENVAVEPYSATFNTPVEMMTRATTLRYAGKRLAYQILPLIEIRAKKHLRPLANLRMIWILKLVKQQFQPTDFGFQQCISLATPLSKEGMSPFGALEYSNNSTIFDNFQENESGN